MNDGGMKTEERPDDTDDPPASDDTDTDPAWQEGETPILGHGGAEYLKEHWKGCNDDDD